jgi:hypothetical protein
VAPAGTSCEEGVRLENQGELGFGGGPALVSAVFRGGHIGCAIIGGLVGGVVFAWFVVNLVGSRLLRGEDRRSRG